MDDPQMSDKYGKVLGDKLISVLGCGNLGKAVVRGLLRSNHKAANILATRRNLDNIYSQDKELKELQAQGVVLVQDNKWAVAKSDIIILAVRPSQLAELLNEIRETLQAATKNIVIVSVVAGLSLDSLKMSLRAGLHKSRHTSQNKCLNKYGAKISLIRSMPNIASSIGEGVSILHFDDDSLKPLAYSLFEPLGKIIRARNSQEVDSWTVLCGCGPAYFFYFLQTLCSFGAKQGLDPAELESALISTMKGAAALLETENESASALIDKIAAPNERTVTRKALEIMHNNGYEDVVLKASYEALARASQIGEELAAELTTDL